MEDTHIIFNGQKVDYTREGGAASLRDILITWVNKHSQFQPLDVMKDNLEELMEMYWNHFHGSKDERVKNLPRKISIFLKFLKDVSNKDILVKKMIDFALSIDGLSNLHGFGFANRFGDRIRGNAETASCKI